MNKVGKGTAVSITAQDILAFWFEEISPKQWWVKDEAFDREIEARFGATLAAARACELSNWRDTAQGRLAEIIVLDQFSRNIYRDQPQAFAQDALAVALTQEAVRIGADLELTEQQRSFMYMPLMHSESMKVHEQAVAVFQALGNAGNLDFELRHKAIIERFGRYPHRNAILRRESTAEELAFLQQPGSSF